jgi:hypothetical protein
MSQVIYRWCVDRHSDVTYKYSCGSYCVGYKPRNGISGCCKFYRKYRWHPSEASQKMNELINSTIKKNLK